MRDKSYDREGTWTLNLLIRSQMRYPLRHSAIPTNSLNSTTLKTPNATAFLEKYTRAIKRVYKET